MTATQERAIRKAAGKTRRGGGVYVYRTRKPGSVIGLVLSRLGGVPWWGWPTATVAACAANAVLGSPWWIGLSMLLCTGRHFAYVGETTSFYSRHRQHIGNLGTGDKWEKKGKPWADLDPVCVLRIPLPTKDRFLGPVRVFRAKWLLWTVERVLVVLTLPVYNDKLNKLNPRRVTLRMQSRQRHARDRRRVKLSFNLTAAHVFALLVLIIVTKVGGAW